MRGKHRGEFGEYRGTTVGVWGELDLNRDALSQRLAATFGHDPVQRVGIVTGSGGSMIGQGAEAGLEELGLNV